MAVSVHNSLNSNTYNWLHEVETFWKTLSVAQLLIKFPEVYELEDSSPYLQELATGPWP
jgi:hypothetical protein